MTSFLFWNVGRKDTANEVVSLCIEHEIDVVVLAECRFPGTELLSKINAKSSQIYVEPFNPSSRLKFFTKYDLNSFVPISDEGGISIRRVKPPLGIEVLLVAVHLPSKLYKSKEEQTLFSVQVAESIRFAEKTVAHTNSIVLGDFNMNPFEDGMVAADGIHGVMDQTIARQMSRVVDGKAKTFFYNPMWSRLGDQSFGPPGTYFKRTGQISHFWHTFDQVLLRPSLLKYYSNDALKVITEIDGVDLLLAGKINTLISDHLPLVITLSTESGI